MSSSQLTTAAEEEEEEEEERIRVTIVVSPLSFLPSFVFLELMRTAAQPPPRPLDIVAMTSSLAKSTTKAAKNKGKAIKV